MKGKKKRKLCSYCIVLNIFVKKFIEKNLKKNIAIHPSKKIGLLNITFKKTQKFIIIRKNKTKTK